MSKKRTGLPKREPKPYEKRRLMTRKEREAQFLRALKAHDCKASRCGPICTFGDW